MSIIKKSSIVIIFLIIAFMNIGFSEPSKWAKKYYILMNYDQVLSAEMANNDKLQNNITREEFADLVVRLYSKATKKSTNVFSEVNPFIDTDNIMVAKAYNIGIVSGVGQGKFKPNDLVTREQIAVMLYNMINILEIDFNIDKTKNFSDESEISSWAKEAVNYAISEGVLSGVGNNKISPKMLATREQAIVMISRIAQKYNWVKSIKLSEDKRNISDFEMPNNSDSQILVYNPKETSIDLRLVSKVVIDGKLEIKKQQIEILEVLDSNSNIDYKNIIKIADIMSKAYDDVEKRYKVENEIVINGYYKYKIYGTDNLTIDCIKR